MHLDPAPTPPASSTIMSGGYCRRCGREHSIGPGRASDCCLELMRELTLRGTIDLFSPVPDPSLATDWLFGPARGKMFGVLECLRPDGSTTCLRAFSGQYNGRWLVEGWVPPLFDVRDFHTLCTDTELRIKELGQEIELHPTHSESWLALKKERRLLSRQLMRQIHELYRLPNFREETAPLAEAFLGGNIPTGTGDCCGPKLLGFAARNRLRPVGLAEFYWGRETRSGNRRHDTFSGSCAEKCGPILGFMLCGLEDGRVGGGGADFGTESRGVKKSFSSLPTAGGDPACEGPQ